MKVKALVLGILLLLSIDSVARTLPTWHAAGEHHHAMLLIPPSEAPVIVRIVDAQQRVLLHLTLEAIQGAKERIDFDWVPTGHYVLEVDFDQQTFYKTLSVQNDRVRASDASEQFQTVPRFDL